MERRESYEKKNIVLGIATSVFLIFAIVATCLWVNTNNDLKQTKEELQSVKNDLLRANTQIEELNLKILDYNKVYGDIARTDLQNNINEEKSDKQVLLMSNENPAPTIQINQITIQFLECVYQSSDSLIQIGLNINNSSDESLDIRLVDAYGNNNTFANALEGEGVQLTDPGEVSSYYYFDASSIKGNDSSQLGNIHCKLIINSQTGENLYLKDIIILNEIIQ